LAGAFGGKVSSGIMLPLLIIADVIGVWYYHRHALWGHLKILFPWAAAGVILGTVVGNYLNDVLFRMIMAFVILVSVGIMLWMERDRSKDVPTNIWFGATTGVLGGFTSMVGNLAGAVLTLYFLSMRLPKYAFIGTGAWFFMFINWFKAPFHIFVWHTLTWDILLLDLMTIPFIVLGAWLGIVIVKNLSEKTYKWFIIVMTIISAIYMLIQ
jgi:uncharacterized membrane protein YfcA